MLEKRRLELEEQHRKDELRKQQEEKERNEKNQAVRETNEMMLHNKIQTYVDILNKTDEKVRSANDAKAKELERQKDREAIAELVKEDNRERIMKMQEFKRQMLISKLHKDDDKTQKIREEKEYSIRKRQMLRREMNEKREKMIGEFMREQKNMNKSTSSRFKSGND